MSWTRNDVDGVLDNCSMCGAYAGFKPTVNGEGPLWASACTGCDNTTEFVSSKFDAAVLWNKVQKEKP